MDPTFIIAPIRWQEEPARIAVISDNGHSDVFFQTTSFKNIQGMCQGRPAEELSRIMPILGPTHHLAAAKTLDDLFAVEPPQVAMQIRSGLLEVQYYIHHLRKLYFLLSHQANPFDGNRVHSRQHPALRSIYRMLDDIMHHLSLAQEAESILGGRCAHPLTAVAGGVSCCLKNGQFERLAEIAESCVLFAPRLAEFFRTEIFQKGKAMDEFKAIEIHPMAMMTLADAEASIVLKDVTGNETESFPVAWAFEKIGLHTEGWTLSPFAYVREKGWESLLTEQTSSLCFVGPLARINDGEPMAAPMAEKERQHLIEMLGPFPHFGVVAAYWALLVELIQAAEHMKELFGDNRMTGEKMRTIPSTMRRSGCAGVESPEGLIVHEYHVNDRGIVGKVRVMSAVAANNALRCCVARQTVSAAMAESLELHTIKSRVEISLLPF